MEQRTPETGRDRSAAVATDAPRFERIADRQDAGTAGEEAGGDGGRPGSAVAGAARALSARAGEALSSLREEGMGEIAEDLASLVRRYPWQAMLIGFSVGYLISRGRGLKSLMR